MFLPPLLEIKPILR